MNMLRRTHKLNQLLQSDYGRSIPSLPMLLRDSHRNFSTENQTQPQAPSQPQSSLHVTTPIDSFLHPPPPKGSVYGRIAGVSPNTLKTDAISLFEGCNLTVDDIKVDYNRMFHPLAMLLKFRSISDFSAGVRELARKSQSFRLEKIAMDHQQWDQIAPYDARYVLFRGIPRNALLDDLNRLLSGCNYDSSSLEIFTRGMQPEVIRMAKVRFPSHVEAMNAVIRKNGAFCLNSRIVAQLIQ